MNNKIKAYVAIIGTALILAPGLGVSASGVAPVTNTLYKNECSGCHFAYQPGLLPARSWTKLLNNLGDHFGENAEVSKEDLQALVTYATANAADTSRHKRSVKINKSIGKNETPLRITETGYIKHKHRELRTKHVKGNPQVKTLSRCEACHTRINDGSFREREIRIPGLGRWED
ncbi:MAG: diheme cytochrome c [Gammaproteobacteria bacterium]|nr:diheme cytochrome c [Gammaproteobacteria bacterium]